jgi:hypothetical protein
MNARGISVFYGSSNIETAMGEVRPPVGSHVLCGRFDVIRPLRLLNLKALDTVTVSGSVFDPEYAASTGMAQFLKTLGDLMVRPVMPEAEHTTTWRLRRLLNTWRRPTNWRLTAFCSRLFSGGLTGKI